jgi:DNA (cytosine-5)-methyltransferase 1
MNTAVSLFAGVGGFDLALERSGFNVVASVEIDKNARAVLEKHFPKAQLFNDVTEVTGEQLRSAGFVSDGGIITGGFPCQDLSVAGRRLGFSGKRSSLFYQFARIIEETQTEWVILENVPGLLTSQRGADMGAVIGTLAELGYGCAWRVLDAKEFGVPQRRRRVFIVAKRFGDAASCAKVLFERSSVRGYPSQSGTSREEIAGETGSSVEATASFIKVKNAQNETDDERWEEGDTHPTLNSFHASSARASAAIVDNESIVFYANHGPDIRIQGENINTLAARMGTGGNNMPMVAEIKSFTASNGSTSGGWEQDYYPTITSTPSSESSGLQYGIRLDNVVRRLTPVECERLQGFPDQWTASQSDSQRYKQMGNAVAVPVVQWIIDGIVNAN